LLRFEEHQREFTGFEHETTNNAWNSKLPSAVFERSRKRAT
jgi:hypothetical protein